MNNKKLFEYCYGCPPEKFPETVIITPILPVEGFTRDHASVTAFKGRLYSGRIVSDEGREYAVVRCGIGSALTGDAVLLLRLTAVRDIFFAGTCGGLTGCRIGDIIICESSFDGEGFTRYHGPSSDIAAVIDSGAFIPADAGYVDQLRTFLAGNARDKTILKTGDIFTIGSLMAETPETLRGITEKGFRGIDMELSSVYHAARATGRRAASLLLVSDLPQKKPLWEPRSATEKTAYKTGIKELTRLTTEFVFEEEV